MIKLYEGDCLEVMSKMEENSVDTIVTDPPYGLEFMGKDWDHGVPGVQYWVEALRVAKPGAMMLCFGGTRTHHRLMCAIEDAGWEIRDVVMYVYGTGFPKSHNISKAIQKAERGHPHGGSDPESPMHSKYKTQASVGKREDGDKGQQYGSGSQWTVDGQWESKHLPVSLDAQTWDGYGTALKPAYEPIIVAMAPRDGTYANNALKWNVAGLWIDGARVPTNGDRPKLEHTGRDGNIYGSGLEGSRSIGTTTQGRWPANLILTYPEDEYIMREDLTKEQKREIFQWLQENT